MSHANKWIKKQSLLALKKVEEDCNEWINETKKNQVGTSPAVFPIKTEPNSNEHEIAYSFLSTVIYYLSMNFSILLMVKPQN